MGRLEAYETSVRGRAWELLRPNRRDPDDGQARLGPECVWDRLDEATPAELASFLDYYGTADEIEIRVEAARTLLSTMDRTALDGERGVAISETLVELGRHLELELRETAVAVEQALEERGWRYEREADQWKHGVRNPIGTAVQSIPPGRVKAIQGLGEANRPEELLNREIRDLCRRWGATSNTQELRHVIAQALAPLFPPDQLDPRRKGPIWTAVDNWLRASRPPGTTLAQTGDGLAP
jgi:hypothetical protein